MQKSGPAPSSAGVRPAVLRPHLGRSLNSASDGIGSPLKGRRGRTGCRQQQHQDEDTLSTNSLLREARLSLTSLQCPWTACCCWVAAAVAACAPVAAALVGAAVSAPVGAAGVAVAASAPAAVAAALAATAVTAGALVAAAGVGAVVAASAPVAVAAALVATALRQGRLGYRSIALQPSAAALREAAREAGAFSSTGQPLLLELQRPPSPLKFCTPLRSPDWEYTFTAAAPTGSSGNPLIHPQGPKSQQQQQQREGEGQGEGLSCEGETEQTQQLGGEPPLLYLKKIRWMARNAALPPHGPLSAAHRVHDWAVLAAAAARDGNNEAAAACYYCTRVLRAPSPRPQRVSAPLLQHQQQQQQQEQQQQQQQQQLFVEGREFRVAAAAAEGSRDKPLDCSLLSSLSMAEAPLHRGVTLAALDWLEEAVKEHEQQLRFSDEGGQLVAHMNLGVLLHRLGECRPVPPSLSPLGDRLHTALTTAATVAAAAAAAAAAAGRDEEARKHLAEAADLGVELNDPLGYSLALGNLSVCAEPSGQGLTPAAAAAASPAAGAVAAAAVC
ncbi:hypothetical protein Emed_006717 [Eimeria media]